MALAGTPLIMSLSLQIRCTPYLRLFGSWEPDSLAGEYEVESILDHRRPMETSTQRSVREFLVKWVGYDEPTWEPMTNLSCGGLLYCRVGSQRKSPFRIGTSPTNNTLPSQKGRLSFVGIKSEDHPKAKGSSPSTVSLASLAVGPGYTRPRWANGCR
ncbi:unnamed protein product [Phytophthora fragariaefolia]|uniref:Unnamed protein product n=1 Tax=Phytophthora fragariaefolia TaxID=1490495 RepID=A0A9W6Y0Y3_9STRA|nr:unnamed protein product [Phytophthora fragariaefolia]